MDGLIFWLAGAAISVIAVPFFPRREAASPMAAIGFALMLGAIWPLLVIYLLRQSVLVLPWWYALRWVDYRQFLNETRQHRVSAEHKDIWQDYTIKEHPQEFERAKVRLQAELSRLQAKGDELSDRRFRLEERLKRLA